MNTMNRMPADMRSGMKFKTNSFGVVTVIDYSDSTSVTVSFENTGWRTSATARNIRMGSVKDVTAPSIYGVACIGDGKYRSRDGAKKTLAYRAWMAMLARCYSDAVHKCQPTYKGCTVCNEWRNFQNFAPWFYDNYVEGFELDKDIAQINSKSKIYSPSTCTFISKSCNVQASMQKSYAFKNPLGELVEITNLTKHCKDNGLHAGHMSSVHLMKLRQHKGWTKA